MKTRISIIGTAGRRREDKEKLTKDLFNKMVDHTEGLIIKYGLDWEEIILVSGGAAWADHIAVKLYKKYPQTTLILYIPTAWDLERRQYYDNGSKDWKKNPGRSANRYHRYFSEKIGYSTLHELDEVKSTFNTSVPGFHERNTLVADSDIMYAYTFSESYEPYQGGTKDTWKKSKAFIKVHVSLDTI